MDKIERIVEEEFESAKRTVLTRIKSIFEDGNQNSAQRSLKLQFKNRVSQTILTGDEIKAEGDTCIEVALVDSEGNIVEVGPEAFASVEIVLLKGESDEGDDDWTFEKFNENTVGEMDGKKLLAGNERLKLEKGIGFVDNIKFRHRASKIKPSLFRLGARVVDTFDGVQIKEAKTECFAVKDFRNKYYIKREIPSLSDAVPRLSNIRKGGKIDKRLQLNKIYTVEDFLIRLLIDPEGLKSIVKLGARKWEVTVDNARRACPRDGRMYCYINFERQTGVAFNVLGHVLGLYLNNQYTLTTMLSENHEAVAQELLSSAYKHWDGVKTFDDENALGKYLTGLSISDSLKPDYRGEMVGESNSRSNFSVQSISSAMNSITETGDDDLISYYSIDDMEIVSSPDPHSMFDRETLVSGFDDFYKNVEEQGAATAVAYDESGVVEMSNRPKRWKKLFCVSRVFSIRKKLSVGGHHNQKKQKTR